MPTLTLPTGDPAIAIRDVAETDLRRRLVVTRDTRPAPALTALLTAVTDQAHNINRAEPEPAA